MASKQYARGVKGCQEEQIGLLSLECTHTQKKARILSEAHLPHWDRMGFVPFDIQWIQMSETTLEKRGFINKQLYNFFIQ